MTSTRERQRAAARARLEREMAERVGQGPQAPADAGDRRRRLRSLVLVVAGTVWLATTLGGDDDKKQDTAAAAGVVQCAYTEVPKEGRTKQIKDVGLPADAAGRTRAPRP